MDGFPFCVGICWEKSRSSQRNDSFGVGDNTIKDSRVCKKSKGKPLLASEVSVAGDEGIAVWKYVQ